CIDKINRIGAGMLGWDEAWLAGKPFSRWVANTDKQLFHEHQQKVRGSETSITQELCIKNRQGRIVTLRLDSVREKRRYTPATACRSIMIDISGELKSARKLRRLQSQLNHLARLHTIGELAASLAHELNQPLGVVMLNCETALRLLNCGAGQDDDCLEALTQASEAALFASEVVRQLRGFLRNDGDTRGVCAIDSLIEDVSTLIEVDARDNDVELQLDLESDLPKVCVNAIQIEQVLLNLAHNSIEAMRENRGIRRRVTVRAQREGPNHVLVSVSDTGPGLSAQQLKRLFVPFYTSKTNGMGLGLSISRTIIEAHGGRLWPAEDFGSGATIHFVLPAFHSETDGG
ncbi:MAG: sensor histidine kinase, partial [Gammaproteobacteria bacterium]